jgi:hypothetical protein
MNIVTRIVSSIVKYRVYFLLEQRLKQSRRSAAVYFHSANVMLMGDGGE